MQLSLNLVRQFVKIPNEDAKDIALALTMSTVEVEDIIDQAKNLEGVVVGKVREVVKHPQADRLYVCTVDIKSKELQIICGGTNVKKGMLVAVAQVGTIVRWHGKGDLIPLDKAKIRGIESFGMIASSDEIGLQRLFPASSEHEILDLTKFRLRVGDPLSKALGLDDVIFVIDNKSMTHRPDLWGQYGLARELAAIYSVKLKPLKTPTIAEPTRAKKELSVDVRDTELCWRYSAVVIDAIKPLPSPWWLKRELESLGINSVNHIVDVTNYVTVILGQPIHAFDYQMLADQKIIVETANHSTSFSALTGKSYTIPAETLMIKDGKKNIAIAGIVGGANSHVSDATTCIVLEAANFSATSVRRSSLAMGLRTEASSRFEKKLDPELVPQALMMAVDMLKKIDGGSIIASSVIDKNSIPTHPARIDVPKDFLDKRLGATLEPREVISILKRLSFAATVKKGVFSISVPSFRSREVEIPEDIVEEVARIYGYNNITAAMPRIELTRPNRSIDSHVEREIKTTLTLGFGYFELYNYSFSEEEWSERLGLSRNRISVKNAIAPEMQYLRTSLLPGLLASAEDNIRWRKSFKLFELGRVFSKASGEYATDSESKHFLPKQPLMLSGITLASDQDHEAQYREVKGTLQALCARLNIPITMQEVKVSFGSSSFEIRTHDKTIGSFGFVKKDFLADDLSRYSIVWWELQYGLLIKFADFSRTYIPLKKYPTIVRKLAIIVDSGVTWGTIDASLQHASPHLVSIDLFDVYTSHKLGKDKKSFAFSLTFRSDERTLESKEVDHVVAKIQTSLQKSFGAVIR